MDLTLPDEIEMLRKTVRRFVRTHLAPLESEIDQADHIEPAVMARLRAEALALGLFGYNMPEELGGLGLSALAQCVVDEELGRTSMALGEAAGHLPGSLRLASRAQLEWLVAPLLRAEKTIAYALTEPNAGSDLSGLLTRSVRDGGNWTINGSKQFISGACDADYIIVLTVTDPAAPLKERFTTFIVERSNPGLAITRRFRTMGWRGYPLAAFSLVDCCVPDSHRLGKIGQGFEAIMATVNRDRLFVASRCLGIAAELLDLARAWVLERRTFGRKLAEHPTIQFALADIDTELDAARLLVMRAALHQDNDHPDARVAASKAKLFASEMAGRAADGILQIFGGAGYMCDLPVERFYRDVRAFRIGEGTSEMQRLQIARHFLAQ